MRSDAGRRIAQDVVEAFRDQLIEHAPHAVRRQRVLVARLGGGEYEQRVDPLVLDQRLLVRAVALNDVDEVVHDAAFASHHEIEIAQADVEVDDCDLLAATRETARETGRRRRFADAAFARRDDDDLGRSGCGRRCGHRR
jgi:hypothetical protein